MMSSVPPVGGSALTRFSWQLSRVCKAIAALACAVLAVLITVVVFQRFVTHQTPRWAEELPRLVLVWGAFIGGVVCSRERSHLMAGILPLITQSERVQGLVDRLVNVLVIAGLALLGWAGWVLAQMTMDQKLTAIDLPAGLVYLALPVACALTAIVHLAQLFEPWTPPPELDLPLVE